MTLGPHIPIEMLPQLMRQAFGGAQGQTKSPLSLVLPKPYADWQRMLMHGKLRLGVFALGTKAGKSIAGANRICSFSYRMTQAQDALYRIIAPTYPLSSITFRYLHRLVPPTLPHQAGLSSSEMTKASQIWERFTPERWEAQLKMRWRHNQALIQCVHGQDPEVTIEGARVHGNVIDEASKMKRQVYASALSTTSQTGGWNILYSTPRGKNYFYDLYMECQEHMRWAAKTGSPLEMFSATATTLDSPFVDTKVVEQARKTLPDRLFRQLYLAEFISDGTVFVGFRECVEGELIEMEGRTQAFTDPQASEKTVVIGADWAKRQDAAVFVAFEIDSNKPKMVGFRRLQGVQYIEQVKELYRFCKSFKDVAMIRHDRTGIGDVIDELLSNINYPIDPIVFTNQSKAALVDQYSIALSTKSVRLLNWSEMISEHDVYDVKTNNLGKPVYGAMSGYHDDIITAIMLAWSAVLEARDQSFDVLDFDSLKKQSGQIDKDTIEGWYQTLIEDNDDDSHEFSF